MTFSDKLLKLINQLSDSLGEGKAGEDADAALALLDEAYQLLVDDEGEEEEEDDDG